MHSPISIPGGYPPRKFSTNPSGPGAPLSVDAAPPDVGFFDETGISQNVPGMTTEKTAYGKFLAATLDYIQRKVEDALGPTVEIERTEDTLSIQLEGGHHYYLNTMELRETIGLASPLSGRHGFYYDKEKDGWISARNNVELYDLLEDEFTGLCGCPVPFD